MKLNLSPKVKNILWWVYAVALLVVCAIWFISDPPPEHIEDTNGADNYSLQTITEENVIKKDMGSRGSVSKNEWHIGNLSSGVKFSSKKFTGVDLLYSTTLFKGSDIYVSLSTFEIKEGNFAFYIVFDGEIVGKIEPSDDVATEFTLENVDKTGALEYIIAGESASFSFVTFDEFGKIE